VAYFFWLLLTDRTEMGSSYGKAKSKKAATTEHFRPPAPSAAAVQRPPNPQAQITQKDRAVLDLKNARDKIRRFRGQMEKDSQKLEAQARALIAARQKTRALLVLKLKRHKEKELEKLDAQLLNVYAMIQDVEWASINLSVLASIESGTRELQRIHEERSVEDVEALMEETMEAIEVEKKINRLLAGQGDVAIDDAELEKELEDLMRAEGQAVGAGAGAAVGTAPAPAPAAVAAAAALPTPPPAPVPSPAPVLSNELPAPPTVPPLLKAPTDRPRQNKKQQPAAVPA
jgi:hydroxymethylglutaryl-CoA lyase/charged multivesicular body protein 6